jgi:dienelactone hydrolase
MRATVGVILLALSALWGGDPARAGVVEEVVELPVPVATAMGRKSNHLLTVTVFRDDGNAARAPFLVLNHGRAMKAEDRARLGRARYAENARYFVSLGYAVFVPTRVGYGVTGGPDLEDSGACDRKYYRPGFAAAAAQSVAVIDYAKRLPYVDASRGLVVGQSFGGATAIALAAEGVPGVVAAVNFAGGGGGRLETHPEEPCRSDALRALFASYGTTARIPTLWLYSENDRYFGTGKPRQWFDGFVAAGGQGRFVALPPYKTDGHPSFTGNPAAWKPAFEAFVRGE